MPNSSAIQHAKKGHLEWIMVRKNDPKTLKELKRKFNFHDVDLQDTAPPLQHHKLAVREDYIYMILQYPVFDRATRIIVTAEINFFIGVDRLVTVDVVGLEPLQSLFASFSHTAKTPPSCLAVDMPHLLYQILDDCTLAVSPMLRHMSADVEGIEERLFGKFERDLIKELLRVKTNIVNVRKAMQGHKGIIRKLIDAARSRFAGTTSLDEYFDQLITNTKDIWDGLELQKETIDALHETNVSLLDYQTNEIMKMLTMMSAIIFPLTLVASVFSMNAGGAPLIEQPYGFWIIMAAMAVLAVGMLAYFKAKKWF